MAVAAETVTRSIRGIDVERFFAWVVNSIKIDGQLKCDVLVGRRPTAFETQTIRNEINKKWHVIPVQQTSLILHVFLRQSRNYPIVPVFAKLATPITILHLSLRRIKIGKFDAQSFPEYRFGREVQVRFFVLNFRQI